MKKARIAVIALGKRNAGKSSTWYTIFGKVIRSGVKSLQIQNQNKSVLVKNSSFEESGRYIAEYFDVLVRNASFEEYGDDIEDWLDEEDLPNIFFCSVQYNEKGKQTITWLKERGYYLYIQWLNPGHYDNDSYNDWLEFEIAFKDSGVFDPVSGKERDERTKKILDFLSDYLFSAA